MVITQGDIWWADLGQPVGSAPGYRRPMLVVQCDAFNRSRIDTVLCVPLTANLHRADAPGNVLMKMRDTGLAKDSVANVSLTVAIDKGQLLERAGHVSLRKLELVFAGINAVLGR